MVSLLQAVAPFLGLVYLENKAGEAPLSTGASSAVIRLIYLISLTVFFCALKSASKPNEIKAFQPFFSHFSWCA